MGRVWVAQQPFRISASFYNVGELREKQRCYSKTFEYGYSSWNVYVQKILKKGSKGPQLGVSSLHSSRRRLQLTFLFVDLLTSTESARSFPNSLKSDRPFYRWISVPRRFSSTDTAG